MKKKYIAPTIIADTIAPFSLLTGSQGDISNTNILLEGERNYPKDNKNEGSYDDMRAKLFNLWELEE